MGFTKGQSGNVKGRPKGAVNKTTGQLRGMISDFLTKNFSEIENDFYHLSPKERAKVYCDLLQYAIPKMRNLDMNVTHDKNNN